MLLRGPLDVLALLGGSRRKLWPLPPTSCPKELAFVSAQCTARAKKSHQPLGTCISGIVCICVLATHNAPASSSQQISAQTGCFALLLIAKVPTWAAMQHGCLHFIVLEAFHVSGGFGIAMQTSDCALLVYKPGLEQEKGAINLPRYHAPLLAVSL